jgi:hypothetical protein
MIEELEENSLRDLSAIPQNPFQDAFQNWKKRGKQCIEVEGSTLKETSLIKLINILERKFGFFLDRPRTLLGEKRTK